MGSLNFGYFCPNGQITTMEPLANKTWADISTLDVEGILYLTFSLFISKTA
jgi:hypothetical protein